jgi:hypothetical protein
MKKCLNVGPDGDFHYLCRRDLSEEAVTCVLRLAKLQLLGHTREDNEQVQSTCPYTQE